MTVKGLLKTAALALGVVSGATAYAAGAYGDIYDIRACEMDTDGNWVVRDAWATAENPLEAGQTAYFMMRLLRSNTTDSDEGKATQWDLTLKGIGTTPSTMAEWMEWAAALASTPFGITVYVSGEERAANVCDWKRNEETGMTDIVFSYQIRSGDVAFPIVLADASGAAMYVDGDGNQGYKFVNADKWQITNAAGETFNPSFITTFSPTRRKPTGTEYDQTSNFNLEKSGLYARTIDFDGNWDSATVWREIHEGTTTPVNGYTPSLKTSDAGADYYVTMYVWSANPDLVTIEEDTVGGTTETKGLTVYENGAWTTKPTVIKKVTFAGGDITREFALRGVARSSETCDLVLSPVDDYSYKAGSYEPVRNYHTVKVKCGEPLPVNVQAVASAKSVSADSNFATSKATIAVNLTQDYGEAATVTLAPGFVDETAAAGADINDYVRLSLTDDDTLPDPRDWTADPLVLTVPENNAKQLVYVYFLRKDANTSGPGKGIKFTPAVTAPATLVADIGAREPKVATIEVKAQNPVATLNTVDNVITGIFGVPIDLPITVSDTYADMRDQTTGYTIYYRKNSSGQFEKLDGVYYRSDSGVLYKLETDEGGNVTGTTTTLPSVTYYEISDTGIAGQFYIVSPVSGQPTPPVESSNYVDVFAFVKEKSSVEFATADGLLEYGEGDHVTFNFTLSEPSSKNLYVYLKPDDADKAKSFEGKTPFVVGMENPKGILISSGLLTAQGELDVIDGDNGRVNFTVVLSTKADWDGDETDGTVDATYASKGPGQIKLNNVEPRLEWITMNGEPSSGSGHVFDDVAKGMTQEFYAVVDDPGTYDLENDEAGKKFVCRWWLWYKGPNATTYTAFKFNGGSATKDIEGNPDDNPFSYQFTRAGDWRVGVTICDKDMSKNKALSNQENLYTVEFHVDDPQVKVSAEPTLEENGTGAVEVKLSYWDDLLEEDDTVRVKVTVTEASPGRPNYGVLKLDGNYRSTTAGEENVYYLDISGTAPVMLAIEQMDGTVASSQYGFNVVAEVVSVSTADGKLPTSGEDAATYYRKSTANNAAPVNIRILNVAPVAVVTPTPNTNAWVVAGGPATSHPITWRVNRDVDADFTTEWKDDSGKTVKGVQITISGCENEGVFYATEPTSGKFVPDFGSRQGDQTVTVTIVDKDGDGPETVEYLFTVRPSKFLKTRPVRPGAALSRIAVKYAGQKGIGSGHVKAYDATFNGASRFQMTWNCSNRLTMEVGAWGYKTTAPTDDGNLDGNRFVNDVPLDANGNNTTDGASDLASYYAYDDAEYDSFAYGWIRSARGENGGLEEELVKFGPEDPESPGMDTVIGMPTKDGEDDEPYPDTFAEAVFSKEYRTLDNVGDMNQDGVPDRAILTYGFDIYDPGEAALTGNDLTNLRGFNNDEDYLPGGANGNVIVPNTANSWPTDGAAFNAYLEIRGYGDGLNAGYHNGDGSEPNPDYSACEMRAWLAWKGLEEEDALAGMTDADVIALFEANMADAKADLTAFNRAANKNSTPVTDLPGWSPERPTDPTLEDTDADGLPDGYEYWFWYGARVGHFRRQNDVEIWQGRLTGLRLNTADIENFTVISADEIMNAFDPLVSGGDRARVRARDTDNDGLSDWEEFLIGTNPVNCDTDGDGLPDGWEVRWNLHPLAAVVNNQNEGDMNPDGDFMAFADRLMWDDLANGYVNGARVVSFDRGGVRYHYLATGAAPALGDVFKGALIGTGDEIDDCLRTVGGESIPVTIGVAGTVDTSTAGIENFTVTEGVDIALMHDQVKAFFGYDPRVGWNITDNGFVHDRWDITRGGDARLVPITAAGVAVNTRPFTNRDEYLFGKYKGFGRNGGNGVMAMLVLSCTNPSADFDGTTYGESTTNYASAQHGADTDGNGVPDGWEAYVDFDPVVNPNGTDNTGASDTDADSLSLAAEYRSNDGASAYGHCTTVNENTTTGNGWFNKFFPTDPANADTDGDGLTDSAEGGVWVDTFYAGRTSWFPADFTFIYGDTSNVGIGTICARGGGLNPCNCDTDFDGLPDAWEREFAGIVANADGTVKVPSHNGNNSEPMYTRELHIADGTLGGASARGEYIFGGLDGTDGADAMTVPGPDAITGTVRDRDFDSDGLENYQEYLVQTMRLWRYDDAETPLMGRFVKWTGDAETTALTEPVEGGYLPVDVMSGTRMFESIMASEALGFGDLASQFATDDNLLYKEVTKPSVEGSGFDYRALGYFAKCDNEWDPMAILNRSFMSRPRSLVAFNATPVDPLDPEAGMMSVPRRLQALAYVTTDPRQWDTDDDGMDDRWEIYHGLNPLLGGKDIIGLAYMMVTADQNVWTGVGGGAIAYPSIVDPGLDPILAPWRMGLAASDPDGDGLRNSDEAIAGNMTSPTPYHTDPTPLWMTDSSSPLSYVSQYYGAITGPLDTGDLIANYPWGLPTTRFAYEEVEGYDTDGDWRGDNHEVVKAVMDSSDPLDTNDPERRAALYLSGKNSLAYSRSNGNVPQVLPPPELGAYDNFRQFTVEMWVKPEDAGECARQTIFERGYEYPASNLENSLAVWRANFRIALDETGAVYGLFDNDNAVDSGSGETFSTQTVTGPVLPKDEWSHVALSFDGSELKLYVNGAVKTAAKTGLIPANGIIEVRQNPSSTNTYPMVSYAVLPGANTIGARRVLLRAPETAEALPFDWTGDFDQFTDFYKGYVAEVRLWDGARTQEEIASNYMKRMTPKDISENRDNAFAAWFNGATRNDNDGAAAMPAELMVLWNFAQLPSAVRARDVSQTPSGFQAVLDNCKIGGKDGETPPEAVVGWWNSAEILHSTVYNDYHVVPWIKNAVSALPLYSGTFADSVYWSDQRAGLVPASEQGVKTYAIPNGGNPYADLEADPFTKGINKHAKASSVDDGLGLLVEQGRFEASRLMTGNESMVPLGDAYAKRDVEYWDGQGASTVWTETGADTDGDDLPDWWEAYAKDNFDIQSSDCAEGGEVDIAPSTVIDYNGTKMTAAEAYVRDLAHGMQPTKSVDKKYVNREDKNYDGLPDWWSGVYGLATRGDEDEDFDGLSNYTEYLLSEVFDLDVLFSPVDAKSVSEFDTDYFFRIGNLYAGEIFTDHDFMEDSWEAGRGVDYVSRYAWDAASDNDEDRWSALAECRYNSFVSSILGENISHMLGDAEIKDFPIPTIKLTLRYNQMQKLDAGGGEGGNQQQGGEQNDDNDQENTLAPLVIQTYTAKNAQSLNVVPDATFKVRPGESVDRIFYLGAYGDRIARGTLTPGYVEPGSFYIQMAQVAQNNSYTWSLDGERFMVGTYAAYMYYYNMYGPQRVQLQSEQFAWSDFTEGNVVTVSQDGDSPEGYIRVNGIRAGRINTQTGAFDFDMSSFANMGLENPTNGVAFSLREAVFRIGYKAKVPVMQSNRMQLYLGTANTGAVREGRNRVVAFYDLNDDGVYTPGEPLGFANDVDVGWFQGKAELELTDTSPIITRAVLTAMGDATDSPVDGADVSNEISDRKLLYGNEDGDVAALVVGRLSGGKYERFRVIRTLVDGWGVDQVGLVNRVVVDKWLELDQRNFFFEGDVLEYGELDLDWSYLYNEVVRNPNVVAGGLGVTNVTYRIVLGNGDISPEGTNNLFEITTTRHFDLQSARRTPVAVAPGSQAAAVFGARPVFKWTMGGNNSYTAFKAQIRKGGTVVWDSGIHRAPATDLDGVYTYIPEAYAGDQLDATANYTWRVSMYNAKFKTDQWSDDMQFRMNTLTNSYDYGSIKVSAKYFGPSEVASNGRIYVEAYDTPDFTGSPVARSAVADKASVVATDSKHEVNAVLVGLPKGTYYVRAYIDFADTYGTDRERDSWESWGYVSPREGGSAYMFSPTAIVIGSEDVESPVFTCYIEDVDTNGNCLPDAWEMVKNKGSLDNGTENIDDTLASGVAINKALTDNLQNLQGDGTAASGLAAYTFAVVRNAGVAALMLDVDTSTSQTYSGAIANDGASSRATAVDVDFSLIDAGDGTLKVKADGDAAVVSAGGASGRRLLAASVYDVASADGRKLAGRLYTSTDLVNWEPASKAPNGGAVSVDVKDGKFTTGEIDLGPYTGEEKRFFKIIMD